MNSIVILSLWILLQISNTSCQDETISVLRGEKVELACPIDIATCGELHSLKWFKGTERIAVVSGDGEVAKVEGSHHDRLSLSHKPQTSRLIFRSVDIADEDTYLCETTFLEPSELCENSGAYSVALNVYAVPSVITLQDGNRNSIKNGSHIGPMREGQDLQVVCEVYGARPEPVISWHRSGRVVRDTQVVEQHNGLYTVKSTLSLTLSRQELGATYNCRVEMKELHLTVDNQFHIDLQVRPTKINLSGVEHHTVQGTKVLLQCQVSGARPAANMTWYNSSKLITDESSEMTSINTKTYLQNDGTFETISQMIFTATRFENGASMRCEADNIVMREDMDRPLHDTLTLEVMYPPVVSVKPDNITVNETQDFLIFCDYEANPASLESVKWFRNSQEIKLNSVRYEGGNPEQTALLVKNSTRHDIGAYTCELSNSIGFDVSDNEVYVDVIFKPTVMLTMDPDTPVIENEQANITLLCNIVEGNPMLLTRVRWFLDGEFLKELPECEDETIGTDENLCEVDPSKMLLQNVGREFIGNYSCEGFNSAGWGDVSEENQLDIYYEPGNASMVHFPTIAIKRRSVTFNCSIDDRGNPAATRYRWLRGGKPVLDVVTPSWTVDPVGLDSRTTFACYAYNEGGEGNAAEESLEVHAPPAFIQKLQPYTGALFSTINMSLSCRVECIPSCTISWFKDGIGIEESDERYYITSSYLPAEPATGDFESAYSVLHFNMSAWPNGILDRIKDSSNYSCVSTNNSAGPGVRSTTYFGVEYPPENTTLSSATISVEEGKVPPKIVCSSRAYPEPAFYWTRNGITIAKGSALIVEDVLQRNDAGIYTCTAFNKHGNHSTDAYIDIHYKPTCQIIRKEVEDEEVLVCVATGSPRESEFEWSVKYANDSVHSQRVKSDPYESVLTLDDDVSSMRIYVCVASNNVGVGTPCEIEVAGYVAWWLKGDVLTPYILIGAVAALLLAVILVCIIIICICRRKRRQEKSSMHMEEIEDAEFSFMKDRRCPESREPDASENIRHYDQSLRWRIRRFFEKRNSIDLLRISTSNVITYVKKPQTLPTIIGDSTPPSPTTQSPPTPPPATATAVPPLLPPSSPSATAATSADGAPGADGAIDPAAGATGGNENTGIPEATVGPTVAAPVAGVTGESSTAGGSQIEPGEYENLPFHGLQTPPKKAMLCKTNLAPSLKHHNKSLTPSCFPTHPYNYINYQKEKGAAPLHPSLQQQQQQQQHAPLVPGESGFRFDDSSTGNTMADRHAAAAQLAATLDTSDTLSSHSFVVTGGAIPPHNNSASCTTAPGRSERKRNAACAGSERKLIDLETVTPLYENLTDSIQIHESSTPTGTLGTPGIHQQQQQQQQHHQHQDRYRVSLKKPGRKSSSRSNSAVSNSYYDCIKPIPAPRHRKYASTNSLVSKAVVTPQAPGQLGQPLHHHHDGNSTSASTNRLDPIYMNLPLGKGLESSLRLLGPDSAEDSALVAHGLGPLSQTIEDYPMIPGNHHYLEITQRQTRIVIPKELFPVDSREQQAKISSLLRKGGQTGGGPAGSSTGSSTSGGTASSTATNSSSRRHIKLPLQKHHSFNFQPSQTVEATVRDLKIKSHSINSKTLRDYRGVSPGASSTVGHRNHTMAAPQQHDSEGEYYDQQQQHQQQQQQQHRTLHSNRTATHFPYDTSSVAFKPITPVPTSTSAIITTTNRKSVNMCNNDKFAIK
ncbi:hemicentin-1 isoform X1 [Anopheles darlingi]|uniref:hemicentin-1 isoform X1 n=1 Tax=Anopheles darlingi TaxID=43151 RepID=UPI0020FFF5BC|nr:hemicentin-1 isoform X1 [Anopheles darlingi]XP_049546888.1 hemicentin-1 isoform X1 [Anopheles darlingi]XP_049546889.1 hemicentin-1 isoform X1 [Anopheles darlingi]XP_049546890.1 hemicentin-1 isoform X1 [Anopheles darlingi]XP_049546891.1 hemicentin-1 isoform X1 [Anopheles darlingi]XP_049546892.1 hemicentin-1 isoform X1 [Anopheles darlingi]